MDSRHLLGFLSLLLVMSPAQAWIGGKVYRRPINGSSTQLVSAINGTAGSDIDEDGEVEWIYGQTTGAYIYYNSDSDTLIGDDSSEFYKAQSLPVVSQTGSPLSDMPYFITFDRKNTTAWELSGYGNNGTSYGTITKGIAGELGYAWDFRGDTNADYIELPSWLETSDFTVMAWVNSDDNTNVRVFVSYVDWGSNANGEFMLRFQSGVIYFYAYKNGAWQEIHTDALATGVWYHITGKKEGNDFTIYVDGEVNATGTLSGTWATSSAGAEFHIAGANDASEYWFDGTLDHFMAFNRSLSDDEVKQIYNGTFDATLGGEEATIDEVDYSFNPADPHIEETVSFGVSQQGSYNITDYYWDFDDGSAIHHESTNTTSHIFYFGGLYNVTLFAQNETGGNVTVYKNVSVFEPNITIWAQDDQTGAFLANFTLTVTNSTSSANFSADGYFALFNYSSGVSGAISLAVYLSGYNHTTETFNISNDTNTNYTATVYPAVLVVDRVTNYEYPTVRGLPFDIEFSNGSTTKTFSSTEEMTQNISYTGSGVDEYTGVGSIWKFVYDYLSGSSNAVEISLCDEDELNCVSIANLTTSDQTRYVMLEPDGTYKTRQAGGTQDQSGSFAYFPATLRVEMTGDPGDRGNVYIYEQQIPYASCTIVSGCPVGNVTAHIEQDTDGIWGYVATTYRPVWLLYPGVTRYSRVNKTAYTIASTSAYSVRFIVMDADNSVVNDAIVVTYRYDDDGELEELASAQTDVTGYTPSMYFKKDSQIYVYAYLGNQNTGSVQGVFVSQDEMEITLQLQLFDFDIDDPLFSGVSISVYPTPGTTLRENTTQWFNVSIIDSGSYMTNTTVWLNSSSLGFSYFESSSSGSGISFTQNISIPGIVNYSSPSITLYYYMLRTVGVNSSSVSWSETYLIYPVSGLAQLEAETLSLLDMFKPLLALVILAGAYASNILLGGFVAIGLFIAGWIGFDVALIGSIMGIAIIWEERL